MIEEKPQWGSMKLQVKSHPRNYRKNPRVTQIFSAQIPDTEHRRRLKQVWRSIYSMDSEGIEDVQSRDYFVDIQSGHEVVGMLLEVCSGEGVPLNFRLISEEEYLTMWQWVRYGIENRTFRDPVTNTESFWTLFFTDRSMTDGIAMTTKNGRPLYARFSECNHEWHLIIEAANASQYVCMNCKRVDLVNNEDVAAFLHSERIGEPMQMTTKDLVEELTVLE